MKIVGDYGVCANIAVKKAIWFCGGDEPVCVAEAIIRQHQETIGIVFWVYELSPLPFTVWYKTHVQTKATRPECNKTSQCDPQI